MVLSGSSAFGMLSVLWQSCCVLIDFHLELWNIVCLLLNVMKSHKWLLAYVNFRSSLADKKKKNLDVYLICFCCSDFEKLSQLTYFNLMKCPMFWGSHELVLDVFLSFPPVFHPTHPSLMTYLANSCQNTWENIEQIILYLNLQIVVIVHVHMWISFVSDLY